MVSQGLLVALRAHNPWLDQPERQQALLASSLPRPFVPRARQLDLAAGCAELVVGPRQAGKSTWIREALSRQDDPVLVLHAEEPQVRELATSPATTLTGLRDWLGPSTVLVLEEIQHFDDASLLIKGLVDLGPGRRMVATGSSSFAFRARTRESLAGRARRSRLLPFSLAELEAQLPASLVPAMRDQRLRELWQRSTVVGGYPEAWLSDRPADVLYHLVEAFVLRDASDLHTLGRPAAFRKLLELAAADIGNLVNLSQWASIAGVSRMTAERYLSIAEEAHLIRLVPPHAGGKRGELTARPKVYFLDNGLRNALIGGFAPIDRRSDRGALWENAVYGELLKRLELLDQVRFWRSKNGAEVDFVVRRGQRLVAIEVKANDLRQPSLTRAARSFIEAYRPHQFAVINGGLTVDLDVDGVPVGFCPPWDLDRVLDALDDQ